MLTTRQVAEKLNCCEKTVLKLAKEGKLQCVVLNPGAKRLTYRFIIDDNNQPKKARKPKQRFV